MDLEKQTLLFSNQEFTFCSNLYTFLLLDGLINSIYNYYSHLFGHLFENNITNHCCSAHHLYSYINLLYY